MKIAGRAILGIVLLAGPLGGAMAETYSKLEVAALPEYCRDAAGFGAEYGGSAETLKYWRQHLGPEMAHIHHYCRGLLMLQRARSSHPKERAKWYRPAIGEIDYVIRNVNESFVLLPEMLTRKGEALVLVKNFREAEEALQTAIRLKPDYWPAYARLAESFIARNNPNAARDVLKQGLSVATEPRMLQKMLDELDKSRN